ncbi:hypothetical protein QXH22_26820 [Mycobacterium sp. TY814]|nr:hypothetical protein [Mycobacterium sp. TY814]MDP7725885.1 hypothetical protein [Mycobacterium sp. TY814]
MPVVLTCFHNCPVITKPEISKKMSGPTKPPLTPGMEMCQPTMASNVKPRKPSMSSRNPLCGVCFACASGDGSKLRAELTFSDWRTSLHCI